MQQALVDVTPTIAKRNNNNNNKLNLPNVNSPLGNPPPWGDAFLYTPKLQKQAVLSLSKALYSKKCFTAYFFGTKAGLNLQFNDFGGR